MAKPSLFTCLGGLLLGLLAAVPGWAQDLSGDWQGVELNPGSAASDYWPSLLTLQGGQPEYAARLYQEAGASPQYAVRYRMKLARVGEQWQLTHAGIISESTNNQFFSWCEGSMLLSYDPELEKLSGNSRYPVPGCHDGNIELYRVRLKSAATVPAGQLTTIRVSGRNVRWFADAALTKPLNTGNSYRTKLTRPTTFYILQGYYVTEVSPAVPITVQVGEGAAVPPPVATAPPPPAPKPAPPVAPAPEEAPLVLPSVLFRTGTAELMPSSNAALQDLADYLKAHPEVQARIAGHADRVGDSAKNQRLSEDRAAAVRQYLVDQAGIPADRITTIGYGDTKPLYPAPDGRNRRVEVSFY